MKFRLPILFILLFCFCISEANHLIGGEITYTHISSNNYRINVTLYRDCNDGKLDNQGGGSSTSQGSYLTEAFIRTTTTNCQNKNIGSISLTKTGFENITPICDLNKSACGNNPTYPYGIEAHYYTGTINFDSYTQYNGCGFHIFIHQATRNEDINTLATEEEDLYNYVYINPWLENKSSPSFINPPNVLYNFNQPVRSGDYVSHNNNDSIVYKWSAPQKSHNSNIQYKTNYSAQQFISTYCPSGTNCTANPSSNPPQGLYLNSKTGDYSFTPTSLNQTSTRVIEIEQWRKHNGNTYLSSKIRRDILVRIINENGNNAPKIAADETFNLCVGQPFTLDVTASDLTTLGVASTDSVQFESTTSLSSLSIINKTTTSAPYNYLELSVTPTTANVGQHIVRIKAKDNHCSKYGESYKTITLNINPKPEVTWDINDLFCGNNKVTIDLNRNASFTLEVYDKQGLEILAPTSITSGYTHSNNLSKDLVYKLEYQDELGCIDSLTKNIKNTGNIAVSRARIVGDLSYCEGENLSNSLMHNSYQVSNTKWITPNNDTSKRDTINALATLGKLNYSYTLTKGDLNCKITDSSSITITKSPTISLKNKPSFCYSDNISLADIEITPSNGAWYYKNIEVPFEVNIANTLPNKDTFLTLTYKLEDNNSLCKAQQEFNFSILEKPLLKLTNLQICGTDQPFILKNSIDRSYSVDEASVSWRMLSNELAYTTNPTPQLDLPTYGEGIYIVEGTNSNINGCVVKDTVEITVDKNLELTLNGTSTLCQGNEALDLNDLFGINIEGGAWETDNSLSFISLNEYIPNECGNKKFKYVYDRDGCYDDIELDAIIVCAPTFNLSIQVKICEDNESINLPSGYSWSGSGVLDNILNPRGLPNGSNLLTANINQNNCPFDTSIVVNLMEPQTFEIGALPSSICEGETIDFVLESNSDLRISANYCDTEAVHSSYDDFHYVPVQCDLDKKTIDISLKSVESKYCPSHTKNISIQYHAKPSVDRPDITSGCTPFSLNSRLAVNTGQDPSITYSLSSEYSNMLGVGNRLNFSDLSEGSYSLSVNTKDNNGCESKQELNSLFEVWPKPEASFQMANDDVLVLSERQLLLNNYSSLSKGDLKSEWYHLKSGKTTLFSSKNNPTYKMPADTGLFKIMLVAKSNNNCADTAMENVLLVPDIIIFIPNAFTPNNDPPNNLFKLSSDHAQIFEINIYNKWGQKVFNSQSLDNSWDGTYQGQFCPNGVYVYSVKLTNKSGEPYSYQGTVNLIR